ncbi:MAG: bifunctional 5,10-methylenetetrahydrofolate dehydrogenase/5,10-methenyltetrahydrofolate cyclohydrolase [Chitinophagaceae bacterium]
MQILDGKLVSGIIRNELAQQVEQLRMQGKKIPHLAAVLIGQHGASETYVSAKVKACGEAGFKSTLLRFDERISEKNLLDQISLLNENADVDGILVQLPLPGHISEEMVIHSIDPSKDVDGFHPMSVGKMALGLPTFIPATPYGIMLLLDYYHLNTKGLHAVVIGRSHIVGTPMSILLSRNTQPGNCTVTTCHSQTRNLKEICLQGDILIAALGKPEFVTRDMVKEGAIVIDVGITRMVDKTKKSGYRLVGDVHFSEVAKVASYMTPVPGGVGPMTIAGLLKNTFNAAQSQKVLMN